MKQATKFKFKNYIITKTDITIDSYKEIYKDIKLDITKASENELGNNTYCIKFVINIYNENDSLHVLLVIQGNFEYDPELTDEEKNIYFKHNAPAILMPYIRAYVSSITSLSGIPTIVLPTYNFLV